MTPRDAVGVEPTLRTETSNPAARSAVGGRVDDPDLVGRRAGHEARLVGVPTMGVDADRPEPGAVGGPRDRHRLVGRHAGPMLAAVELDEHLQRPGGPGDGATEELRPLGRIDPHPERDPLVERTEPAALLAFGPDGIGEEEIVEPRVGEDLGLADRADGQPAGPGRPLERGNADALVRLRVRPERDAAPIRKRLHPGDVPLEPVEVDDRAWRLEAVREVRRGDERVGRRQGGDGGHRDPRYPVASRRTGRCRGPWRATGWGTSDALGCRA